ncbi:MAG TPA: C-GCAxxG-C-C family protein [Chloroflexota bacterium]
MHEQSKASERVSRRGFLANAGKVAAAAGIGAVSLGGIASAQTTQPSGTAAYPWPYKKVDPEKVYWNGVDLYGKWGCGQGSFQALLTEIGEPFNTIPPSILKFGEGGVSGWGSHCGALLGSSAIISLVTGGSPESGQMIKELTGWYTEFIGSGSPLCHVSVTEWSKANGVKVESDERKARCARVTGETAKKAAMLLNAWADTKSVVSTFGPRATVVECQSCHGANGMGQVRAGVLQDCVPCHTDQPHSRKKPS